MNRQQRRAHAKKVKKFEAAETRALHEDRVTSELEDIWQAENEASGGLSEEQWRAMVETASQDEEEYRE